MDKKTNAEQEATDTLAQLKSPLKISDNDLRHRNRFYRHRKMSFPAVSMTSNRNPLNFHQNPLHFPTSLNESKELINDLEIANRRYRRFSNVSDAVSRKLSTTIGWRTVSVQEIVNQSKSLCGQFIRIRLKRNGVQNKRMGLQRLRSMLSLQTTGPTTQTVCEVFAQLHIIGMELERMHPSLYTGVCRQVSVTITNEKSVSTVLSSVARNLLKTDVTWGKIASLYCVAGGLAIDCVQQGHPEYLYGIVETMGLVIERDAATWIAQQGGWAALLSRFRPPNDDNGAFQMIALSVICLILILMGFVFVLRTIGKFAFSPFWNDNL